MDMKQLEVFTAVVENNSFSRAAQCLHLTQPTVSAHIAALERELQVKLIVRTTKELYPSDAGRLLYRYAKQLLSLPNMRVGDVAERVGYGPIGRRWRGR